MGGGLEMGGDLEWFGIWNDGESCCGMKEVGPGLGRGMEWIGDWNG